MSDLQMQGFGGLPAASEKDLLAMNQLMYDKQYRIKVSPGPLRVEKTDKVNPEFIQYILNDYLGHVQKCVAETRKMLPYEDQKFFYEAFHQQDPVGYSAMLAISSFDIRALGELLSRLQANPREVTVSQLSPFVRLLYRMLIRFYYLGSQGISRLYRSVHSLIVRELVPADPDSLKLHVTAAITEWVYILDSVCTGLYPLLLRMSSPVMLTMRQLMYDNGSKVLAWLQIAPSEVLFQKDLAPLVADGSASVRVAEKEPEEDFSLPDEVTQGLDILETLFPEAGWDDLESMPDLCPYFQPVLQFQDAFTQLAPDNPLHQTMIFFWILEELFQGLRLIKFEPLPATSVKDDVEDINRILEDWILYQESVFDKNFAVELKSYTHQIYTQPDFHKSPYGRKLLSNMYTLIKTMFLPYFDIKMYGTTRGPKDDRLPPFYVRVRRLKRLLSRYNAAIELAPEGSDQNSEGRVPGVVNPWSPYKFDIANPVSKRLDALCGGKHAKGRTNALLIHYTLSVLNVLDWWINNKDSYAYTIPCEYLYRVIEPGSAVPAFGVTPRTDVDQIFQRSLKARLSGD